MSRFLILALILVYACGETKYNYDSPVYQDLKHVSQSTKEKMYEDLKHRVNHKQQLFNEEYQRSDDQHKQTLVALSKKYVNNVLTDTIFPFWYDTKWDYNGTTETPGNGQVACGYFVTTTLKHVGFNVERAKLAQQASSKIIKTICGERMHIIGNNDHKQLKQYMLNQPDGLYIIGLDNHVGFIHKQDSTVSAVHSNGVSGSLMVVKEPISGCKLILRSNAYYIGSIFANDRLFVDWINKKKIKTVI